jgi:hypothetical protein
MLKVSAAYLEAPGKISVTAAIKKPTCVGFQWKVSKGG